MDMPHDWPLNGGMIIEKLFESALASVIVGTVLAAGKTIQPPANDMGHSFF